MNDVSIINITPENIADYGVCGYKNVKKHKEIQKKIEWFNELYPKGLRIKVLFSESSGYQGMLEYLPGEFAHRPVNANGYMFIHCIFTGFKNEFKGKGYGSDLIDECIKDAQAQNMNGVAVVTRKGAFMAGNEIFLKKGFKVVDNAKPDFFLMALKFNDNAENPGFKYDIIDNAENYKQGLTIIRSPQCPYTEKNVNEIIKTAESKFKLKTNLVDISDYHSAQNNPCPFGTFSIIFNGEIISHHPISNKRFENIMTKILN